MRTLTLGAEVVFALLCWVGDTAHTCSMEHTGMYVYVCAGLKHSVTCTCSYSHDKERSCSFRMSTYLRAWDNQPDQRSIIRTSTLHTPVEPLSKVLSSTASSHDWKGKKCKTVSFSHHYYKMAPPVQHYRWRNYATRLTHCLESFTEITWHLTVDGVQYVTLRDLQQACHTSVSSHYITVLGHMTIHLPWHIHQRLPSVEESYGRLWFG